MGRVKKHIDRNTVANNKLENVFKKWILLLLLFFFW